jgi:negative regulator of sigma E activity
MKSRFDELLPFYVNGTLGTDDRSWVESYLREHPLAANELRWLRSVQTMALEEPVAASSEIGLARAMQRIRSERAAAAPPAASSSMVERVREWLSRLVPMSMAKPALAAALAVIALQAVVITSMVGERDDTTELRTLPGSVAEHGPYLKLNFKPNASEADIRMLLIDVQANLASGPGQLGDYYVRVPASQIDGVTARLSASTIVEGVAVVDALPV